MTAADMAAVDMTAVDITATDVTAADMTGADVTAEAGMQRFADFFDAELIPLVRRMADRPRHAVGLRGGDAGNREIRAMVWQGLVSLGALALALPASYGGADAGGEELVALAELLGSALYQGPLLDTITATELLLRRGGDSLLADVAAGAGVALAIRADGAAGPAEPAAMTVDADGCAIAARRCFVAFAAEVDHIIVVGADSAGTKLALVPRDHPSVTLRRYEETGRGELFEVCFADTPVTAWLSPADSWPQALAGARIRQAGYLVGLSQGALDLAVGYAKRRHQFGQPIGRFQALAFRLSELTMCVDAARLLTGAAARDRDRGLDVRLAAAQCLATAAELARAVTTAGMQIHGAAGMTSDCDAQLFYRRAAVESLWLGSPTQLRAEAAPLFSARSAG